MFGGNRKFGGCSIGGRLGIAANRARPHSMVRITSHTVNTEELRYEVNKATALNKPIAAFKTHTDYMQVVVLPKSNSYSLCEGHWLSTCTSIDTLDLPMLVSFVDDRDKCVAVGFRELQLPSGMNSLKVVVARSPLVSGEKVVDDSALSAIAFGMIKSYEPLQNESGGCMLDDFERYLAGSAVFRFMDIASTKKIGAWIKKGDAKAAATKMFKYAELRMRREAQTPRANEAAPKSASAQEDAATELVSLDERIQQLNTAQENWMESTLPFYQVPLTKRILCAGSKSDQEDDDAYKARIVKLVE